MSGRKDPPRGGKPEGTLVEDKAEAAAPKGGPAADLAGKALHLKVLGGRHSGALIPLQPGRYSLGQDEDSDLIFLDDAFLGGKVLLEIGGASPLLRTTGLVKAQVEGRPVAAEGLRLAAYQAVEVGTTRFALGPADRPWPEPASGEGDEEGPALPKPAAREAKPAPEDLAAAAKARSRARLRAWSIRLSVLLFLALVAGSLWTALNRHPDPRQAILAILSDLRLPEVRLDEGTGILWVKGFVATEAERAALMSRLATIRPAVKARIISAEETRAAIADVLGLYDMDFAVEIGPGGKAVLAGVCDKPALVQEILESVRQGVEGETEVEGRIHPSGTVVPWLGRLLSAKVLAHKVRIEVERGKLYGTLVRNQVDSAEMGAWRTIKESFRGQFNLEIEDRWTDKLSATLLRFAAAAQELDAGLRGVTASGLPHVTMRDGRKLFAGARLKSGPYLKSIERDRLVLVIGEIEQNYFIKKGGR